MNTLPPSPRIAFTASDRPEAAAARDALMRRYPSVPEAEADVIVALGGDGFMLEMLHAHLERRTPVFGMNRGSVGFLMNDYGEDGLPARIARAVRAEIHPLEMTAWTSDGQAQTGLAINEVSLLRQTRQSAKLRILVDGRVRLEELSCDGALVSTPAGSTAYNLSAHGPILPIDSPLLALTPISPFRPRRWRGAILNNHAEVVFRAREPDKRPMSAVADSVEFHHVVEVTVRENRGHRATLLFDPGTGLEERVLIEQFRY